MRRLLIILLATLFLDVAGTPRAKWEESSLPAELARLRPTDTANEPVEIITGASDGNIYIIVRQPIQVKLFTILGQLIVQETLQPGTHRYRISNRGIYLLKAGHLTRRITI